MREVLTPSPHLPYPSSPGLPPDRRERRGKEKNRFLPSLPAVGGEAERGGEKKKTAFLPSLPADGGEAGREGPGE